MLGATAATYAVWLTAHQFLDVDLLLSDGTTVPWSAVVLTTVGAGLAGWTLLALLERFTRRGAKLWAWTAGIVLLVSLMGPLGQAAGTATTVSLLAMHLTAGAVLIPLMLRRPVASRAVRG